MGDYTEHLISMAGGDGEPDALDLDAIQARVDAATEGPWHAGRGATSDGKEFARTYEQKKAFLALSLNEGESELWLVDNGEVIPAATGDGPKAMANAEFTAHARTDVPALLALVREQAAQIERVEAQLAYWESMKPFPDADESQRWYSLSKRHAAEAIRAALTATEGA